MNNERHLDLVKTPQIENELRVFPRFPFCYLIFKSNKNDHVFEVKDLSQTGMQLALKENEIHYSIGDTLTGEMHWLGNKVELSGQLKWMRSNRLGLEFEQSDKFENEYESFLNLDHIVKALKPLHKNELPIEKPNLLRYWLCADGPVEIFVWEHKDGELSEFQILLHEYYIEWLDGEGVFTGRILSKRNIDTPLIQEDQMIFRRDERLDKSKLLKASDLIEKIAPESLPPEAKNFLLRKLK